MTKILLLTYLVLLILVTILPLLVFTGCVPKEVPSVCPQPPIPVVIPVPALESKTLKNGDDPAKVMKTLEDDLGACIRYSNDLQKALGAYR